MTQTSDPELALIDPLDELAEIDPSVEEALINPLGPAELANVDPWI